MLSVPLLTQQTPAGAAPSPPSNSDGVSRIRSDQWHLRYLNVADAQRLSRGEGVTVAVPDTGVDPHPDLRNNLLPGAKIIGDRIGDGRRDPNSHGTSMAGLIAAHGQGGGLGALGIAPRAKILPIVVAAANNYGEADDLAAGIEYAISQQADIISISSTGGSSQRLIRAVESAIRADIVVVAGVGNQPATTSIGYPASHPSVIAVAGVDDKGFHAAISVMGPKIDIAAPAVQIYSTSFGAKYSKGTGTSSATAIVAGAAALVRSKYPDLPASEVIHRLTATAVDKGPSGRDDQYGYGVIDLVAALTADVPPLGFSSSPPAPTVAPTPAAAQPGAGSKDGDSTVRGLLTLGVLVVAGGVWAAVVRRRRHGDDPPPRISR
ncbi:S8 family serine peptidase [Micromonospora sp. BQ11]|uniref:S8 family serine peptidase n=1 Tax=Micromonospora sp. BQ11 TaxID=3452212 RepID=UPI003F8BBBCD